MNAGQIHVAGIRGEAIVPPLACPSAFGYDAPLSGTFAYDGLGNLRMASRQHFARIPLQTSSQNAPETGLDYFGVRYMSSAQGRFTSPDPLVWQSWQSGNDDEKARFAEFISDPQNFNLYTYGRNNPLKYNDPTGLDVELAISFVGDVSDEEKKRIMGAVRSYLEGLKVGKVVVRDAADSSQAKRVRQNGQNGSAKRVSLNCAICFQDSANSPNCRQNGSKPGDGRNVSACPHHSCALKQLAAR